MQHGHRKRPDLIELCDHSAIQQAMAPASPACTGFGGPGPILLRLIDFGEPDRLHCAIQPSRALRSDSPPLAERRA